MKATLQKRAKPATAMAMKMFRTDQIDLSEEAEWEECADMVSVEESFIQAQRMGKATCEKDRFLAKSKRGGYTTKV